MDLRVDIARAVGATAAWGLRNVFGRPAATLPGRAALGIDPELIAHLRPRIRRGVVAVVGTNGKTTVTNLLAASFEAQGDTVVCNRTGANLASGVASALLGAPEADWGVFEIDELWLARVAPQLRPDCIVLLDLFRDQLDRMGEIAHIQASVAQALSACPRATLVYNADDPLCQAVADRSDNPCVPFGIRGQLDEPYGSSSSAQMCPRCDSILEYAWRQYGQLGSYRCPSCGFDRPRPAYAAHDVHLRHDGTTFSISGPCREFLAESSSTGAYMVYNMLAVYAAADRCGVDRRAIETAARSFSPQNGRQQRYVLDGRNLLLNLAKNPAGLDQSLDIVAQEPGPVAVAFFINDNEADGHDVSWLWDADFEKLGEVSDLLAYAGGSRARDVQVRLKYAGIRARLVEDVDDFLQNAGVRSPDARLFAIANYTALPAVKAELDRASAGGRGRANRPERHAGSDFGAVVPDAAATAAAPAEDRRREGRADRLVICHMYPDLLNLYGDRGNVMVLAKRASWRGVDVEVVRVAHGQTADLERADIVFLGGGPDREQRLACNDLLGQADALRAYVEDGGVVLAICGGFQIIGREWLMGDETVPGLGLVDVVTRRVEGGSHNRLVGNIVLQSPVGQMPVTGFENHAGRTFLGAGCEPFGRVVGHLGHGNNATEKADGILYKNVVGTYLHGPLLAKNPEVADWLLERALERRAAKEGRAPSPLPMLDDAAERLANESLRERLGA